MCLESAVSPLQLGAAPAVGHLAIWVLLLVLEARWKADHFYLLIYVFIFYLFTLTVRESSSRTQGC